MFKSLIGIVGDVARVAIAPVEVAVDVARTVTKPMAQAAEDVVREVKDLTGADKK